MPEKIFLTRTNRLQIAQAFRDNPRVDLALDCVIEGQMGCVYVDVPTRPTVFQVELSEFFTYFTGDATSSAAWEMVSALPAFRLIMPSAPGWIELVMEVHGDRLNPMDRYSFSEDSLSLDHITELISTSPHRVRRVDLPLVQQLNSQENSFFEIQDFESQEDFLARGVGFCVTNGEGITGVAFSSLVCSRGFEVSIFVVPDHRRQGIATALGAALVKYCLERGMEPHWDAANRESCRLALKLGYSHSGSYSAYFLQGHDQDEREGEA